MDEFEKNLTEEELPEEEEAVEEELSETAETAEELEETPETEAEEELTEETAEEEFVPQNAGFTYIIRCLAGVYLIYLAYSIYKELWPEFQATGWNNKFILPGVGAIAFIIIGVLLLVKYLKPYIKYTKQFNKK